MKGLDDDINVATVDQNGAVRVYGPIYREGSPRSFLYAKHFGNYGQGKLWADEYEDAQRNERPLKARA